MPTGTRPPQPPGTVKVVLQGINYTHRWVNVFYLSLTTSGAVTVTDLQTLANAIASSWNTRIRPSLDNHCVLQSVELIYVPSAGNELVYTAPVTYTGGGADPVSDASAAYVINWVISAMYRGGHPRSYWPGCINAYITNGSDITGAGQTALNTAASNFRNDINALTSTNVTGVAMGTVSFASNNAWRTTPVFRAYTSNRVRNKLGSQRRRILS